MSRRSSLPNASLWPIEHSDLPDMLRWRNSASVYRWCRQFEPISMRDHEAWFGRIRGDSSLKMYAIKDDDHRTVGICGLTSIDRVNSRAEFSLYVGPEHQGAGYGEAALRSLCDHGFYRLNLNMIWGESFDGNPATKMFERVGFHYDGSRRAFYFRDGQYTDAHLFSLLREEYDNLRNSHQPMSPGGRRRSDPDADQAA